jgi:hypothetical protein
VESPKIVTGFGRWLVSGSRSTPCFGGSFRRTGGATFRLLLIRLQNDLCLGSGQVPGSRVQSASITKSGARLQWMRASLGLGLIPDPWPLEFRGCSSAGRAPDLHSGGRRFDPDQLHQVEIVRRRESEAGMSFWLPEGFRPLVPGHWPLTLGL